MLQKMFTGTLALVLILVTALCLPYLVPKYLITSLVFLILASGFGLHLPTVLACYLLYSYIHSFDSYILALVVFWAIHKLFVRVQLVFDIQIVRFWSGCRNQ